MLRSVVLCLVVFLSVCSIRVSAAISATADVQLLYEDVTNFNDSACYNCSDNGCERLPDTCVIDDVCFEDGDVNPTDSGQMCLPDESTSQWIRLYPTITSSLEGPTTNNSIVCRVSSNDTSPTARYRVSWYVDNHPYPRQEEFIISPGPEGASVDVSHLPSAGMLTCKVHSFYSDRRLPSPDAVSNGVDLGRISVMAEKVDTVDEFFFVEHHTAGEISKEITDSAGTSQVITTDYLKDHYHDDKGALECRNHTVYLEKYSPSAAALDPGLHGFYPLITTSLEGPTVNNSMVCRVNTNDTSPTARYRVSWYLDDKPYPRQEEFIISPGPQGASLNLADLPMSGMLTCKVRSFYSDRRHYSPYIASQPVDLAMANVIAERVATVLGFSYVEHKTGEQITVTIMSSHEQDFTSITAHDLATRYHDYKGAQECQGHTVYLVDYTPSDDLVG
ncbi:hypothetical protein BaRGS_00023281 [Batillaria attramentaria]|uniref:Ig-like domain-containing protein n=1 Tax=Batillaria attramentaria TaxID=370345 RepID=A0ABD0KE96_9CAEN